MTGQKQPNCKAAEKTYISAQLKELSPVGTITGKRRRASDETERDFFSLPDPLVDNPRFLSSLLTIMYF